MRIAYVINSMEGGGAQSPLPRIVGALHQAGAEVTILALTRRNGKAVASLEKHGVALRVREGGERDHPAALRWIMKQARMLRSEVLWTSLTRATLLGQIAGGRLGLPVVSWQHNAYLKPWNERLLRLRARASDLWVADSEDVADLTRRRLGVAAERLVTWPIFAADPAAPQARPAAPGETLRIGSLGRLHPNKGYDVLIEAIALLAEREPRLAARANFVIGGTGADEADLKRLAETSKVPVTFAGHIADPAAFLATCHGYVQPSRREGFCIAAHEAMQASLPMVVSRTGQMPLSVADAQAGMVVDPGAAKALYAALAALIGKDEERVRWGANARRYLLAQYSQAHFDAIGAGLVERIGALLNRR